MKLPAPAAPPFIEAQATAWLRWLARSMTAQGQTIFQIEGLQPSWLATRGQRWAYILASRLVWGVAGGLIFLLVISLSEASHWRGFLMLEYVPLLLYPALICGLIGGLIDGVDLARNRLRPALTAPPALRRIIAGSLLSMLIFALIFGLSDALLLVLMEKAGGPGYAVSAGLMFGLVGGLVFELLWMQRSFGRDFRNEIRTVETVRFSWASLPQGIVKGLFGGLGCGMIIGMLFWLRDRTIYDSLAFGLSYGFQIGLIISLVSCLQPGIRELKIIPNQGIRLSLRSAGLAGVIGGLGIGTIMGLLAGPVNGLACGVLGGLCLSLWFGGLDVIQHYIVRLLLVLQGAMPWNYARFLDYAAEELNFLQKVGGGYMFVHRYLLEYFAAIEQPKPSTSVEGRDVAQPAVDMTG